MSIQRYGDPSHDYMTPAHDEGFLVLYTDHVAAVAAARSEEVLNRDSVWGDGYSQAMHDAFGDMSMEEFVAAAEQRGIEKGVVEGVRSGREGALADALAAVEEIGDRYAAANDAPATDAVYHCEMAVKRLMTEQDGPATP